MLMYLISRLQIVEDSVINNWKSVLKCQIQSQSRLETHCFVKIVILWNQLGDRAVTAETVEGFKTGGITTNYLSRRTTQWTKWPVRPAKTQISLGIRPVWLKPLLWAQWVAKDPSSLHADIRGLWSDWADAQADLSLQWVRMPLCWFCHEAAHFAHSLP